MKEETKAASQGHSFFGSVHLPVGRGVVAHQTQELFLPLMGFIKDESFKGRLRLIVSATVLRGAG